MKKLVIPALIAAVSMSSTALADESTNTQVNFAFGGARTDALNGNAIFQPDLVAAVNAAGLTMPGLPQQLAFAEATLGEVDEDDVFYLSVGTNDFLTGLVMPGFDVQVSVNNIVAALEDLYTNKDARYIVVPNLAPVGLIPLLALPASPFAQSPVTLADLNKKTSLFNKLLADAAKQFERDYCDARIVIVDVEKIVKKVVANRKVNSVLPCTFSGAPSCEGFLFVDFVHPTTTVYAKVAEAAHAGLKKAGFFKTKPGDSKTKPREMTKRAHRVITFGDSLADTGSFNDVVLRATRTPGLPEASGYFAGRFSDGLISIDYLENLLDVKHISEFFPQPASN